MGVGPGAGGGGYFMQNTAMGKSYHLSTILYVKFARTYNFGHFQRTTIKCIVGRPTTFQYRGHTSLYLLSLLQENLKKGKNSKKYGLLK